MGVVSEDLVKSQGVKTGLINLFYLLLVGVVVALGVKFLGTLLTGAMVILPAVTAKNIAKSIKGYYWISIVAGVVSSAVGIIIARHFNVASGPAVVLTAIAIFALSFILKRK